MIYVRNNISILTFEWIPIIEVCLQQEIRKKIHILKVPLTIVSDQVPKKWVSGFGGFMGKRFKES